MLFMGKSTISMAIFNSFLYVYQRVDTLVIHTHFMNLSRTNSIRFRGEIHDYPEHLNHHPPSLTIINHDKPFSNIMNHS